MAVRSLVGLDAPELLGTLDPLTDQQPRAKIMADIGQRCSSGTWSKLH